MEDEGFFSISVTLYGAIAMLTFSKSPVSSFSHCVILKSVSAFPEMPVLVSSFYRGDLDDRKTYEKWSRDFIAEFHKAKRGEYAFAW